MIDTITRALPGYFLIFAQNGRQFELLEVVGQQHLWRTSGGAGGQVVIGRPAHAAISFETWGIRAA